MFLRARDLFRGDAFVGERRRFGADERQDFGRVLRPRRRGDREDAAGAIHLVRRIDAVDQAPLLADLLEKSRRHAAAEDRIEHGVDVSSLVRSARALGAAAAVGLYASRSEAAALPAG